MRTILKKTLKFFFPYFPNKIRVKMLRLCGYIVGSDVYVSADLKVSDVGIRSKNLIIGNRVSIGPGVIIVTDSSANNSKLTSIYPLSSGVVILEDDCWLTAGAILLPGIKVGRCSIIAAGAVVTEDVTAFSIYGGIPAKKIKSIEDTYFKQ